MTAVWALPPAATATVTVALVLVWVAYGLARRERLGGAAVCLFAAALVIRMYAAADRTLHPWDERYHALVAKNLISDPLKPTLYARPLLEYDYREWTTNHVWLHKPPLALWAMAASMRVFGINELAMRLPSVLASASGVVLTFGIGKTLFDWRVGLVAATFHTFNGMLVSLAAGRRASDHVDTLLIFLVALGIWAGLRTTGRHPRLVACLVGAISGLALLTKSLAGLVILPIWAFCRWHRDSGPIVLRQVALAGASAAVLAAPWTLYIWRAFPREAAYEQVYALRHITEVLEEQGGPAWQYLLEMPRFFGDLVFVPLAWSIFVAWGSAPHPGSVARGGPSAPRRCVPPQRAQSARRGPRLAGALCAPRSAVRKQEQPCGSSKRWSRQALLIWIGLPYAAYSAFATKMPAYVMVAAPAVFLMQADFWVHLRQRLAQSPSAAGRVLLTLALILFAVLPARNLLEPTGPLEPRPREPQWVRDLKSLNAVIGREEAVVLNVPYPIEAMFYTPYIVYPHVPDRDGLRHLAAQGHQLFVYDAGEGPLDLPPDVELKVVTPLR